MVLVCHVKPVLILPVPFMTLLLEASSEEKYLKMTPKVLLETGRNIYTWKETDKSQNKKPFLLLVGQGIGVNNGGSCPKAQYLAAGGQYECSAWRANSIRKWIFTDG